jgi:ABC-type nickel/cobalt efflux system permease component RcnA
MTGGLESLTQTFLALHRWAQQALTAALAPGQGEHGVAAAAAFALALGAQHAITPGHGKSILLSYFLGRDARPVAGLAASLKIAAGHVVLAAVLVGLFGAAVGAMGRPAGAAAAIEIAAYAIIAASGAWMLIRCLAPRRTHEANPARHRHAPPVAAALIPCPLTMLLLIYGLANASAAVVAALLAAFMGGIVATLSAVATAAIVLRRLFLVPLSALPGLYAPALRALEAAGAAAILAIGLAFLARKLL